MEFKTAISNIGRPRTVREAVAHWKAKDLAAKFGVSKRTAERWRSGEIRHPKAEKAIMKVTAKDRQKIAANAFRSAGSLQIGAIKVVVSDERPTARKVNKTWRVNDRMREGMNRAAAALDRGDLRTAEAEMNKVVLREYADTAREKPRGGGKSSADNTVPGMHITDWGAGFDVV